MLIKRIFWTLLITGVIVISTTASQAQSTDRKLWPRGDSGNNPVPVAPDQAAERALIAELETAFQEAQATEQGAQGGFLDVLERQKTAIVGSWLGTTSGGERVISAYNSDGTFHSSAQAEIREIMTPVGPALGGLTSQRGVWKHLGGRQFGVVLMGIFYDTKTGAYQGMLKVRILFTLNEAGDQLSGTDKVEIITPNGTVIPIPGGATSYTRIKFEPFN